MDDLFRTLPGLLREFEDNQNLREAVVRAAWRRIAGDALRERSAALHLEQKRLIVAVESDTWKKHLEDLGGQMIFKINSALGQALVTFIEFRVDPPALQAARRGINKGLIDEATMREAALEEVTVKLRRAADSIKDEDLRYSFLLAAGSALAQKKRLKKR